MKKNDAGSKRPEETGRAKAGSSQETDVTRWIESYQPGRDTYLPPHLGVQREADLDLVNNQVREGIKTIGEGTTSKQWIEWRYAQLKPKD
jgi:hypothetical protein